MPVDNFIIIMLKGCSIITIQPTIPNILPAHLLLLLLYYAFTILAMYHFINMQ